MLKLEFQDGDFVLLFKSDVPASIHKQVRGYHHELLKQISSISDLPVWPPEDVSEILYQHFRLYYQKVLDLLGVDGDRLHPISRHLFLICTEPQDGTAGLSLLEQLMGYTFTNEKVEVSNAPTTGDECLDVKTDLFLIFKRHAPKLWLTHSLEECALLCRQANERMRDQSDDGGEWEDDEIIADDEDELFVKFKAQIMSELAILEVLLPQDF